MQLAASATPSCLRVEAKYFDGWVRAAAAWVYLVRFDNRVGEQEEAHEGPSTKLSKTLKKQNCKSLETSQK
jgi:hypothetical protein